VRKPTLTFNIDNDVRPNAPEEHRSASCRKTDTPIHFKQDEIIHEPITDEYIWNGKWYDHYPTKEIEEWEKFNT
jgi:hypothetical protein